jgi:hypothetical protein
MVPENFVLQCKAKPTISVGDIVSNLDGNPAERRGITDNFRWKYDNYFFVA